ncbi:Protein NEOXANTHIN-DEFICIENT 1 [Linum perenne]
MEEEAKSSGYGKPPWIFKGSALYQLHLVKADTARAFVPKDSRLVEAFGYTLGGFFLANYEDSPAGSFDELVVIAGIVWNPPTSCAWAARVLVSSEDACHHGRKEVGLPSHVAKFSKVNTLIREVLKLALTVLKSLVFSSYSVQDTCFFYHSYFAMYIIYLIGSE